MRAIRVFPYCIGSNGAYVFVVLWLSRFDFGVCVRVCLKNLVVIELSAVHGLGHTIQCTLKPDLSVRQIRI